MGARIDARPPTHSSKSKRISPCGGRGFLLMRGLFPLTKFLRQMVNAPLLCLR